ncbi:MAG: sigma-54 dependent transcriptional regulator [Syntrophobacteraceae bacterium]
MPARILVVDDEESIRYTFDSFLEEEGHSVVTAEDSREALAKMAETRFDVIYMDILLGGGSGIDLLRQVKLKHPDCPVILITGLPCIDSAAEALRLGAFDYLIKPVKQEQILQTTREALKRKRLLEGETRNRSGLEAVFHSVMDAIVAVDAEKKIVEINRAALELCGFSREDIGQPFRARPVGCPGTCLEVLDGALRTRKTIEAKGVACRIANRPKRMVHLVANPLLDASGSFSGVVMVLRDESLPADLPAQGSLPAKFHKIVGRSASMQRLYAAIDALADVQTTVLITGETGTGKELVAEALHHAGDRRDHPLIKVNCSSLAENLLESELFGHVKGAFTGAVRDKTGRFQQAHRGTIFLDEIADLSPRIQQMLLRVLQEREFERVGDARTVRVDVRVVAATNRPLQEMVARNEFRQDLYYRLKVVELRLPPLRERREDIPLLVTHFLRRFSGKFSKQIDGITQEVLQLFHEHRWPGNVRELEHTLEHAFVLCRDPVISIHHLPSEITEGVPREAACSIEAPEDEMSAILDALEKTAWNKARAARLLQVDRKTLYRKMQRLQIPPRLP